VSLTKWLRWQRTASWGPQNRSIRHGKRFPQRTEGVVRSRQKRPDTHGIMGMIFHQDARIVSRQKHHAVPSLVPKWFTATTTSFSRVERFPVGFCPLWVTLIFQNFAAAHVGPRNTTSQDVAKRKWCRRQPHPMELTANLPSLPSRSAAPNTLDPAGTAEIVPYLSFCLILHTMVGHDLLFLQVDSLSFHLCHVIVDILDAAFHPGTIYYVKIDPIAAQTTFSIRRLAGLRLILVTHMLAQLGTVRDMGGCLVGQE
jgi:hypothetical protein